MMVAITSTTTPALRLLLAEVSLHKRASLFSHGTLADRNTDQHTTYHYRKWTYISTQ